MYKIYQLRARWYNLVGDGLWEPGNDAYRMYYSTRSAATRALVEDAHVYTDNATQGRIESMSDLDVVLTTAHNTRLVLTVRARWVFDSSRTQPAKDRKQCQV